MVVCKLRLSTAGFNDVCVCSLHSTTCLSGGYPVTLTCWHYTKHWSLSTCNYYSNMDSCKCYYGHGQPGSPLLLYNYLRTNNTLQPFLWFYFFCLVFLNVWIYKLWTVLRSKRRGERGLMKKNSGLKRRLHYPAPSMLVADLCENPVYYPCSRLKACKGWKPRVAWEAASSVSSGAQRPVSGLLWVTWNDPSSINEGYSVQAALCVWR